MSNEEYERKRNLTRSGEPRGECSRRGKDDDKYADARRNPVSTERESVMSGRTLSEVADEDDAQANDRAIRPHRRRLFMNRLEQLYNRLVLGHPAASLACVALVLATLATGVTRFDIDASSDSLLLESDAALERYRSIRARYGSDDFLVVTYTPQDDLFSQTALQTLQDLRDELAALDGVNSITSILDVPLFESPPATAEDIAAGDTHLLDPRTDIGLARDELRESPLYADELLSNDAQTTAVQIDLQRNDALERLLQERATLRAKRLDTPLEAAERKRLRRLRPQIRDLRETHQAAVTGIVRSVRNVMSGYADDAELHLSGLPMINTDIVAYIRHDLVVFGSALITIVVAMLAVIFREWRWVVLPVIVCAATILAMLGILGLLRWAVTVVSSNFVSLLLILTLALNIHLIVRYRELDAARSGESRLNLVRETVRSKFKPALLTAVSTIVAFGSLVVSDIRPVIDFGLMMVGGLSIGFLLTFLVLPPLVVVFPAGDSDPRTPVADAVTGRLSELVQNRPSATLVAYAALALACVWGISSLNLENRFIDYFDESTEIYQGMTTIDRKLGGTTPLEVVLDAPQSDDGDAAPTADIPLAGDPGFATTSYWYDVERLGTLEAAHDYLYDKRAVGSVVSLHSTMYAVRALTGDGEPDNFTLSVVYERLPPRARALLFDPYIADDGDQIRLAARTYETLPDLDRTELIRDLRDYYVEELGLDADRVHVSGLFVLYNNVLESLLRSQLFTVACVFVAIVLMFSIAFRSLKVAAVAAVPNVLAAATVLAIMGALGISLDIMTIAIAAVAIGIGVDDTVHYVHRFETEASQSDDLREIVANSHRNVGRAIFYTTIVIITGFAALVFSEFVPTGYFGLLTGLAMAIALIADLTLLPLLLVRIRAFGTSQRTA